MLEGDACEGDASDAKRVFFFGDGNALEDSIYTRLTSVIFVAALATK